MVSALLIDLALLAVLVFFTWLGVRKGFILTLCSLIAVLVALVGANLTADVLSPKLAQALQPQIEQSIRESLEEKALEVNAEDSLAVVDALAALKEKGGLYQWAAQGLEDALRTSPGLSESIAHQAAVSAASVAGQLARGIIFSIAFLVILVAWAILSRALDLVSRLPGINSLNRLLGGAAGFVKGLVIAYLAAWILSSLTGLVPPETAAQTRLFLFLTQHGPLELLLMA